MAVTILHPQWGESRPVQGVLFDMDGLVLDSEILYSRFWREACGFYGYDMSYQQSLRMRALNRQLAQKTLAEFFGPGIDYDIVRNKRIELMNAFIEKNGVPVKPGIYQLMEYLKRNGIASAITSSSPIERIQNHLSRHGLADAFDKLCSGHDVPRGKPEPDIYLHGAASLGLDPKNCLALEDSATGILSAYRAGCLPVMIPDLDQPAEETKKLLYAQADDLNDIISLIEQHNARL